MKKHLILLTCLSLLASVPASRAATLDIDFQLTGFFDGGATVETVTGTLVGLTDDSFSQPSDIIFTSAPVGITLGNFGPFVTAQGSFNVVAGSIVGYDPADPDVPNGVYFENANYLLAFNFGSGTNLLQDYTTFDYVSNDDGEPGVTYGTVPEPSTYALLGFGLLALLVVRRTPAVKVRA